MKEASMPYTATEITLSGEEQKALEQRVRSAKTEQRQVLRSRIVLGAGQGVATNEIARRLGVRPATVSKWRTRFAEEGLSGLEDAPRSGAPAIYDEMTERRILAQLDEPIPGGETVWTARLIARELRCVSVDHVWRVLRKHGIHLQRRRSWCISTDPEFARKAADIVGLYLAPPDNAIVICVDEKPSIQALERAQGYLKLYDGTTSRGFSSRYKRHGTTTLFAVLEVATGMIRAGHYRRRRRRRREFLDFMNHLIAGYPSDQELHVVLDNLATHKKKHGTWLSVTPTCTSTIPRPMPAGSIKLKSGSAS